MELKYFLIKGGDVKEFSDKESLMMKLITDDTIQQSSKDVILIKGYKLHFVKESRVSIMEE